MMDFFKQLFHKQEKYNIPIVHEVLKRSEEEMAAFEIWKLGAPFSQLKMIILEQFELRTNPERDAPLTEQPSNGDSPEIRRYNPAICNFLISSHSNGFILPFREDFETKDYRFFFDYLKQSIKSTGYRSYLSDVKRYSRTHYLEEIERHYLKPPPTFVEPGITKNPKANQRYGNINIELNYKDKKAIQIKFLCNSYADRQYTEPLVFEELIYKILS